MEEGSRRGGQANGAPPAHGLDSRRSLLEAKVALDLSPFARKAPRTRLLFPPGALNGTVLPAVGPACRRQVRVGASDGRKHRQPEHEKPDSSDHNHHLPDSVALGANGVLRPIARSAPDRSGWFHDGERPFREIADFLPKKGGAVSQNRPIRSIADWSIAMQCGAQRFASANDLAVRRTFAADRRFAAPGSTVRRRRVQTALGRRVNEPGWSRGFGFRPAGCVRPRDRCRRRRGGWPTGWRLRAGCD